MSIRSLRLNLSRIYHGLRFKTILQFYPKKTKFTSISSDKKAIIIRNPLQLLGNNCLYSGCPSKDLRSSARFGTIAGPHRFKIDSVDHERWTWSGILNPRRMLHLASALVSEYIEWVNPPHIGSKWLGWDSWNLMNPLATDQRMFAVRSRVTVDAGERFSTWPFSTIWWCISSSYC